MHTTRRFTLIELLTVIAIIAVLMGILLPGIAMVQKKAKITQAKGDMMSLMTAIKMYESTYGYLPCATDDNDLLIDDAGATNRYDQLIAFLSQTDRDGVPAPPNPAALKDDGNLRGIKMLEVSLPGVYLDPWNQKYYVVIDANYTGGITIGSVDLASAPGTTWNATVNGGGLTANVTSAVLVFSKGPDTRLNTNAGHADNKDNIYTVTTNWSGGGHVLR